MNKIISKDSITIKRDGYTVIWGNKYFNLDEYIKNHNISSIGKCDQFHSNIMLESNAKATPRCDAIFTTSSHHALVIKTADCVPILVKHHDHIFALHAGWRGLCDEIIFKLSSFEPDETATAFIGPHIAQSSYEVGPEVIEQIITNNIDLKVLQSDFTQSHGNKFLLNLGQLAQIQLRKTGISKNNISIELINTFSDLNWHSYRRDQALAGRNLSLIVNNH